MVWRNRPVVTFGIERIVRLTLIITGYFFLGLFIRHFTGKHGHLARKLGVDIYVFCKLFVPVAIFLLGWEQHVLIQWLVIYLAMETVHYNINLLFLSDLYVAPYSIKRSYIMTLMNYMELCLEFAVIYKGANLVTNASSACDAIYFSFVSAFTLGDGSMGPSNGCGRFVMVVQCLCSLILVTLVFTKIVSGFGSNWTGGDKGNLLKSEPRRETLTDRN